MSLSMTLYLVVVSQRSNQYDALLAVLGFEHLHVQKHRDVYEVFHTDVPPLHLAAIAHLIHASLMIPKLNKENEAWTNI